MGKENNADDAPVEPQQEGDSGKSHVVYISKPDFSSLSRKKQFELRDKLARQIKDLKAKCQLDRPYQRRYAPDTVTVQNGLKTIVLKDKDGVTRKLVFKQAESREADERKADPAFQLPPRPTPTYLDLLLKKLPSDGNGERGTPEQFPKELAPEIPPLVESISTPNQEEKVEKFKGPSWDSQKDVDE